MKAKRLHKYLWWMVAGLILVVIALWGNKYRNQLATLEIKETAVLQTACDLRQAPCTARFETGDTLVFEVNPKSIPLLEPLELTVKINTDVLLRDSAYTKPIDIHVDFVGIGMEMGFNRAKLDQQRNPQQSPLFQGTAILPICSQQRMNWEARVLIHTPSGVKAAIFPFYTLKNTTN